MLGANNSATIVFDYVLGQQSLSLAVLLANSFFIGVCFASLFWFGFSVKLKLQLNALRRKQQHHSTNVN